MTSVPKITLTEEEDKFFSLVSHFLSGTKRTTVVRVAGGWVRDKILNRSSTDIDLVIDESTPTCFANDFVDYINSTTSHHPPTIPTQSSDSEDSLPSKKRVIRGFGVIKANPDQSKHLETVTFNYNHLSIDINALRSEEYAHDSRIPTVNFTEITPLSDAHRRDYTINSLFYNLNRNKIEDFVNGLSDLSSCLLKTPLDPFKTFTDDPLRLLRGVRFSACLNFNLDEKIKKAAISPLIRKNLFKKVSRERIGQEIKKALTFTETDLKISLKFFELLHELNLEIIVLCPNLYKEEGEITNHISEFNKGLSRIRTLNKTFNKMLELKLIDKISFAACLAAYFSCLENCSLMSLKYSKQEVKHIEKLVKFANDFYPIFIKPNNKNKLKMEILKIYYSCKCKQTVKESILLMSTFIDKNNEENCDEIKKLVQFCDGKWANVLKDLKPKFNGKAIKAIMKIKNNSLIGKALELEMEWMFGEILGGVEEEELREFGKESGKFKEMVSFIQKRLNN